MNSFHIPTKDEVFPANKKYFDYFNERLGMMPNLYAVLAQSEGALESYVRLHNRKQLLSKQEQTIVGLIVAAVNESEYCLHNYRMAAELNGFSELQVKEIENGTACFDPRMNALASFVMSIVLNRGKPDRSLMDNFFAAGYGIGHLIDIILLIGDGTIASLAGRVMNIAIDK